jgi:phosphate transport system substrate-binding protein
VILILAAGATAPILPAHASDEVVRVGGTGAAVAAMERLGEAYRKAHGATRFQVLPSIGSTGAVKAVAEGAVDVAVSGRALTPGEAGLSVVAFEFARTPFAFAVNPRTEVSNVTSEEMVRIYRGELTRWPNGERVRLVLRPGSDADTQVLRSISPEMSLAVGVAQARPGMLMAVTNNECNEMVERTPGAIGPTSLLQVLAETHALRLLAWNGVRPDLEALASGRYPLVKPLFLVIRRSPPPAVSRFVGFLASPAGREILASLGAQAVPFPPVP